MAPNLKIEVPLDPAYKFLEYTQSTQSQHMTHSCSLWHYSKYTVYGISPGLYKGTDKEYMAYIHSGVSFRHKEE